MRIVLPEYEESRHYSSEPYRRQLTHDFVFEIDGYKYTILKGFWWDGASIPRFLWRAVGSPFTGKYYLACLVHDLFYATHYFERGKTDEVLYEMNKYLKVGWCQNNSIYQGVNWGGYFAYNNKTEEQIAGAMKHLKVEKI